MAEQEASERDAGINNDKEMPIIIESLKPTDILIGRGTAYNEWQGNQQFRSLVKERRYAYNSADGNETKSRLAQEFLDYVKQTVGARFLRIVDTEHKVEDIIADGKWTVVGDDVALEKIKQAFRQRRGRPKVGKATENVAGGASLGWENDGVHVKAPSSSLRTSQAVMNGDGNTTGNAMERDSVPIGEKKPPAALKATRVLRTPSDVAGLLTSTQPTHGATSPLGTLPVLPSTLLEATAAAAIDPRTLLFQCGPVWPSVVPLRPHQQPTTTISSEQMALIVQQDLKQMLGTNADIPSLEHIQNYINYSQFQDTAKTVTRESISEERSSPPPEPDDAEDAALALYALMYSDWPKLSKQEHELEKASMTNEERAAALADLFGEFCSVSDYHPQKRARRDLDKTSIDFLIEQMKLELGMIPVDKKEALLEAQQKCRSEEFSDGRYEKFLRSQGMNAKLAAQRFVNYWESRRELLGPDKYHLRMTLSEAFCDDIDAIKKGVFCLLPSTDLSGRPLIVVQVHRLVCDTVTPESLVRSIWYYMEVMAREHGDFVWILSHKGAKIWNYNRYLITHIPYYYAKCWPIRNTMPTHVLGTNKFLLKIFRPVLMAKADRANRNRGLLHDCEESEWLDVLAEYGIQKDSLPTELGGPLDLDEWLNLWIAQRRSMEMEEL